MMLLSPGPPSFFVLVIIRLVRSTTRPRSPDGFTPYIPTTLTDFYQLHLGRGRKLGFTDPMSLTLVTSHWHHPPVTSPHRLAFFFDFTWPALPTQVTGRHQLSMHTGQDHYHRLGIYLRSIFHGNSDTVTIEAGGGYACRIAAISWVSVSLDPIFLFLGLAMVFRSKPLPVFHVCLMSQNKHLTMSPDKKHTAGTPYTQ
ncbi:hypothetical protein B0T18DRAFT_150069 [Schizothecium vesticola]|uniref:Uncharacterized protein n=1 Tax=Schizothecium vesticola TaxID=314040 RepID=A0AA40EVJ5_9PEZI|nr:hypothetical protein B0T18DRAFT_150069 [Schizothecium vesticola]